MGRKHKHKGPSYSRPDIFMTTVPELVAPLADLAAEHVAAVRLRDLQRAKAIRAKAEELKKSQMLRDKAERLRRQPKARRT